MKCQAALSFALIAILALSTAAPAFETDQYALPPVPLADIGDEVSDHVAENIGIAVARLNLEIAEHQACVDGGTNAGPRKCGSIEKERAELSRLRSKDAVAESVFELLGKGSIFTTNTGKWFESHKFTHEPSRFKTDFDDTIFKVMPVNYLTISPTVRLYGSEFGFDKIDHFFQQGYKYYTIYVGALADGKSPEEARKKAIGWGKRTERTYFGTLVSGVYSNGDLFANFAGMKFYQHLTGETDIAGRTSPALLELRDGFWRWKGEKKDLLRPFIGDQMNEALNPSGLTFILYPFVKKAVLRKDCDDWRRQFPTGTATYFDARTASLETWSGEDYGFTAKSRRVKISSCFREN